MSKILANLTLQLVTEEIENTLDTYPDFPYKQAFSIPELRHQLTAYVMNEIPCNYTIIDHKQKPPISANYTYSFLELRWRIEPHIHRGIQQILQANSGWFSHPIPEEAQSDNNPSNWFG